MRRNRLIPRDWGEGDKNHESAETGAKNLTMKNILAFGGGVDSTALLLILLEGHPHISPVDAVVFADPGAEWPETYQNIERAKSACEKAGIEFVTVRKGECSGTGSRETITEWITRLGVVPLLPGGSHVCSLKFKGEVMQRWAEQRFPGEDITWYVGIEADEEKRSKRFTVRSTGKKTRHSFAYPLQFLGMTRADCIEYLRESGWGEVHKSSCVFCPFMQEDEIKEAVSRPETRELLLQIEMNFKQTSSRKFQAWQDAGEPRLGTCGRAPKGMWAKDSWASGARLFAKSVDGRRLSVSEWIERLG